MTNWIPDLSRHDGPKYRSIADAIEAAITEGALAPGDRLPPQRSLAWDLGVTVGTVSRAYALAEQRQLVEGTVGRGTFVCDGSAAATARPLLPVPDSNITDLSLNATLLNATTTAFGSTIADLSRSNGLDRLLEYSEPSGHAEHRAAAAQWMSQSGLKTDARNIILTAGAQQALAASVDVLTQGAPHLFIERLTYPVLKRVVAIRGIRLTGIALDAEGMVPELLDAAARAAPDVRAVVTVPTLQNPTAVTMSTARRQAIADIARRRNLVIIEDDVYGYVARDRPPPLANFAPERTVYLTSASKCTAPGLRVGWISAPPDLREKLTDAVYATTLTQPALTHEVARRWIEDGTAARLTDALRDELAVRHELAAETFSGIDYVDDSASPHILLPLPQGWRTADFVAAVQAKGFRLAPVEAFAVGPSMVDPAVRISLGAVRERAVMAQCLAAIRSVLDSYPAFEPAII